MCLTRHLRARKKKKVYFRHYFDSDCPTCSDCPADTEQWQTPFLPRPLSSQRKQKQRMQHLNRRAPRSDELDLQIDWAVLQWMFFFMHWLTLCSLKKNIMLWGNSHYFCSLPFAKIGRWTYQRVSAPTKSQITPQCRLSLCFCLLNYNSPSVWSWAETKMSPSSLVFVESSSVSPCIRLFSYLPCYVIRLLRAISVWTLRGVFPGCCSVQTFSSNMQPFKNVHTAC